MKKEIEIEDDDWDCYNCEFSLYDPEFLIFLSKKSEEPIITQMVLCNNENIKDMYYNGVGESKTPKNKILDIEHQLPIPIGKVCWSCNGKYFKRSIDTIYDII